MSACQPIDLHPWECDGPGKCVHCDRAYRLEENWKMEEQEHDPATCALCDPAYDHMPNPHWKGAVSPLDTPTDPMWDPTVSYDLPNPHRKGSSE